MAEPILSTSNPRVKKLVKMRNRRERERTGLFLIEGFRELSRAVQARVTVRELYVCPALFLGANEGLIVERAARAGAEVVELGEDAFRKVSYRDRPEGLLGLADQFPTGLQEIDPGPEPLLLVVESIEKPGNLGTMLRTAEAAGAAGVIVCDPTTDPFNPNVVRASLGCIFLVPVAVTSTRETIVWLRGHDVTSFAATPAGTLAPWAADLTGPAALVIGSEQYGLSDAWLAEADQRIAIPMAGQMDSLNAATAAAVVLFEAVRQREAAAR